MQRHARLQGQTERQRRARSAETSQQRQVIFGITSGVPDITENMNAVINLTGFQKRRHKDMIRHAMALSHESFQHRQRRLAENRRRATNYLVRRWISMNMIGFNYDSSVPYDEHPNLQLGAMDSRCIYCGARTWQGELASMCCADGKVRLPLLDNPPEELLRGWTSDSKTFLKHIRRYNAAFRMTSFSGEFI